MIRKNGREPNKRPDFRTHRVVAGRLFTGFFKFVGTALGTAILVSLFVGDPQVVPEVNIPTELDQQFAIADLENQNALSRFAPFFRITDPKISINFFTLIQKKDGNGSVTPCWINGTQSTTTSLGYGMSLSTKFNLLQDKPALLNANLHDQYNAESYIRINYSYNYQNRLSSEKRYSGVKVYILFPESTSTMSLVEMYADGDSPVYPTNLIAYPTDLVVAAPVSGFSAIRNPQELECQNYHIKNVLGSQQEMAS